MCALDTSSVDQKTPFTLEHFSQILQDTYRIYKRDKVMPKARLAYCNGYVDALLTCGLIDEQDLQLLVDNANKEVFGMTLQQRQYEFDVYHDPQAQDANATSRSIVSATKSASLIPNHNPR
jgi:hypothetical protein